MHGIIVACHNLLSYSIYTTLISMVFGTAITMSFNILMKMFYTCFTGFHCITKCILKLMKWHATAPPLASFHCTLYAWFLL